MANDPDFEVADTTAKWNKHPFFAPGTVVLGIDIGIEGIGIAIRVGHEIIYAKTLMVDLPKARPLADRRQNRGWRHTRKNRKLRLRRLRLLFEKHGLPWLPAEIYGHSDPYKLRARAITPGKQLASREALSLCIRSIVSHRGFDYYAMCTERGNYPWGESTDIKDALKWLNSQYVNEEIRDQLINMAFAFSTCGTKEITQQHLDEWERKVTERCNDPNKPDINALLLEYAANKANYRRARGWNFPRSLMETHLRQILEKHRHLIDDYDSFIETLFHHCTTKADKKIAIFHYNRKTPAQARANFERKVKQCPYLADPDIATSLGHTDETGLPLAPHKCGTRSELAIRRWHMLDFLSVRRFELELGKLKKTETAKFSPGLNRLPETVIQALDEAMQDPAIRTWSDIKKVMTDALKTLALKIKKSSTWNTQQLDQLKDICKPSGKEANKRANMSVRAAELLIRMITARGYAPESLEACKQEWGLYEKRARIENSQPGIYPQVRELLGTLRLRHRDQHSTPFSTQGLLQRLFDTELKDKLGGKTKPDYCIIECVKDPARNADHASEIQKKIKDNRERKEKFIQSYGRENPSHADILRMQLFEEQGGKPKGAAPAICPFTGQNLGTDPFSPELNLAHLFPDALGGLYIRENLVLTTRQINTDMGKLTPYEAASAGLPGWSSWDEIKKRIQTFHWGKNKHKLFTFQKSAEHRFPEFNNITRTAQLARELRRLAAVWMGISSDVDAIRERIGNPSGSYTAAARRGMLPKDYEKDRTNNLHHRIDAAVLTCIPPASGLNDVRYGGIFQSIQEERNRRLVTIPGLPLPDFDALIRDTSYCPIIASRSNSNTQSLGDSTFWAVNREGKLTQRAPLNASKFNDAAQVEEALLTTGIPAKLLPDRNTITQWLLESAEAAEQETSPAKDIILRLKNGRPVKSIHKPSGKGEITNSPLGWSGLITPKPCAEPSTPTTAIPGKDNKKAPRYTPAQLTEKNVFSQLRSLNASNDRLELWLGWNGKAWQYYTRVIPVKSALAGLKRMGLPWRGRANAPEYLIRLLDAAQCKDLKQFICGTLPPHAIKVGTIRKGDIFVGTFKLNDKAQNKQKSPLASIEENPTLTGWGKVSALMSTGRIKISSLTHKNYKPEAPQKVSRIAVMLGLPEKAADLASLQQLVPPHDSSPDSQSSGRA